MVTEDLKGKRADVLATETLPILSRAYIHKLFENGRITVNDQEAKAGYRLREGDSLHIDFDVDELETTEEIELPILYEDKDVLVIDKPAGVISHARGRFWNEPSVASFIRQKTSQEGERAGIVHRLDRVTSGVMICAKNSEALAFLQKQFSDRKVRKTYIAIVKGHMKDREAIIDMPIGRNPHKPQTFHATEIGKPARTKYKVIRSLEGHDVVELEPETGRTHQIRVHLLEVGHSIVGDHLYGGEKASRLYLHANTLTLKLPNSQKTIFTSPLPEEFAEFEAKHG